MHQATIQLHIILLGFTLSSPGPGSFRNTKRYANSSDSKLQNCSVLNVCQLSHINNPLKLLYSHQVVLVPIFLFLYRSWDKKLS